jgi:riboflavin kinase/FMN adenylyltransferase
MKELSKIKTELKNPVVTVGTFDGVHLGHQKIMRTLVKRAKAIDGVSVVVTYHPHPLEILNNRKYPYLLTEKEKKERILKELGVDYVLWLNFDNYMVNLSADEFIREYFVDRLHAKEIIVGYDWHFGKNREGDYHLLKRQSQVYGYKVDMVKELKINRELVSSTRIREYIRNGEIEKANMMLGRDYSILGKVVGGDRLGRKLGFPTTNLVPKEERKLLPKCGVYLSKTLFNNENRWGLTYVGKKPTIKLDNKKKFIETYIFDFNKNIYLEDIELFFVKWVREDRKFLSTDELIEQIRKDEEVGRKWIQEVES